jgi:hypothetical protein
MRNAAIRAIGQWIPSPQKRDVFRVGNPSTQALFETFQKVFLDKVYPKREKSARSAQLVGERHVFAKGVDRQRGKR